MHPLLRGAALLGSAKSSLLTGLAAYWKLDEASGSRLDSVGSNHLTSNNSVGQAAGKVGNCATFAAASTQYLSVADNAALRVGGGSFTLAGWFWFNDLTSQMGFMLKNTPGLLTGDYSLYRYSDGKVYFDYSDGAGLKEVGSTAQPTANAWHFVAAWLDTVAQTQNLQIDNGTIYSVARAQTVTDLSGAFRIGGTGTDYKLNGKADECGLWKRVLTVAERTQLYNNGNGVTHPNFS